MRAPFRSVFTLSPPGDLYEAFRTWEAIEAGSIPVLVDTPGVYKACDRPSVHHFWEEPFALQLGSWDELPAALEAFALNSSL